MRGASMDGIGEGCPLRTKSPLIIIIIIIIKQTCHQRERERGPNDSDEDGGLWPAINISPSHFDHNSLPKVPGSWQIGRLATGRIYLVAARHGKGRGEGREGGREGGRRKGGEESGSGLCSLSLSSS